MSKASPPQPPNPQVTAAAQTGENVSTGIANAFLNNINQITPQGELRFDPTDTFSWADPSTGQTYNIPRFTATQILSPQQQAIQDQSTSAQYNLAGIANTQSGRVGELLSDDVDLSNAPRQGDYDWIAGQPMAQGQFGEAGTQPLDRLDISGAPQRGFNDPTMRPLDRLDISGNPQWTFENTARGITGTYGPEDNFSADRARVEESLYGRLNPQLERERANIEQRLADQGIEYGSPAYTRAMDDYNRQANDARLAVTAAGGQEQQRMNEMAARQAGFQNAAQMQDYQQRLGRGEFYNRAQQQQLDQQAQALGFNNAVQRQQYEQALGRGTFYNQAQLQQFQEEQAALGFNNAVQQQQFEQAMARGQFANTAAAQNMAQAQATFNAAQAARNQYLQEQYTRRNQPINEITALLRGGQVTPPNFVNTPGAQIANTDVAGIINTGFNQQMATAQMQNQQQQQLMGGLFGLAGGLLASDREVKRDIDRVGTVFATNDEGERERLPIYQYSYKDDSARRRHTGPMAQDVEKIDPRAVRTRGGVKHIDVGRTMGSIFSAAA